jgi:hypothetical protein
MEIFTWTVTLHTLSLDALRVTNFNRAVTLTIPEKDRAEGGWDEKNKGSPDPESTVGDKDQLHFAVAHPTLPQQFNY